MTHHLTPMQVCERLIGKPEAISIAAGLCEKAAYNWRYERKGRAAGDLTSSMIMRSLLTFSAQHGLGLTAEHLVLGALESDIVSILETRETPGKSCLVPERDSYR